MTASVLSMPLLSLYRLQVSIQVEHKLRMPYYNTKILFLFISILIFKVILILAMTFMLSFTMCVTLNIIFKKVSKY